MESVPGIRLRRWLFTVLVVATTAMGTLTMYGIMRFNGLSLLELLILGLFTLTFAWISVAFWTAATGFLLHLFRRDALSLRPLGRNGRGEVNPLRSRTALVMPAYHEDLARTLEGVERIVLSLEHSGWGEHFDFHLLSDSTHPDLAQEEERVWDRFRLKMGGDSVGLHYRRRRWNHGRKAGNIMEFCDRAGHEYDFMVVLDADSVMGGETLLRLVRLMEASPSTGMIQTVPIPARQDTLFGRILQFGAALHSPMLASGQSFWWGDAGNYWGHNAIVRVAPFREHCRLPRVPGRPPLGGEILSHDFVEAALLRGRGWKVVLLPHLEESYEEVPNNLLDYAVRDRRWAQGSLQHLRLLTLPRLSGVSRLHFVLGAMGYVASLLWFVLLLAGTAYVLAPAPPFGLTIPAPETPLPGPGGGGNGWIPLLGVTAVLLFLPKGLGLTLAFLFRSRDFGSRGRLVLSALLEALFSVVMAPLMMLFHSRFVLGILAGREVAWQSQNREGRELSWREAWKGTVGATTTGVIWSAITLWVSGVYFLWLSPILIGLLLAAPLARWTSRRRPGLWTRRRGLFLSPWEIGRSGILPPAAVELPNAAQESTPEKLTASSSPESSTGTG